MSATATPAPSMADRLAAALAAEGNATEAAPAAAPSTTAPAPEKAAPAKVSARMEALKALREKRSAPVVKDAAAPAAPEKMTLDPAVAGKLARYEALEKATAARVKAALDKVPAEMRAAFDATDDPFVRAAILDGIERMIASTPAKVPAKSAGSGAPAAVPAYSLEEVLADETGAKLDEMKAKNPTALQALFSKMRR